MTLPRRLARLFADRRPRRISFIKRDGSLRFMTFEYQGGAIVGNRMWVFDLEAQSIKTIDLSTVQPGGFVMKQRPALS